MLRQFRVGFVEPQIVEPEDLMVIGHIFDLLVVFALLHVITFYRQKMHHTISATRVCSTAAVCEQFQAMARFNLSGRGIQLGAPYLDKGIV